MITSSNDSATAKRDLHVGGVGAQPGVALTTMAVVDPLTEVSDTVLRKVGEMASSADDFIRKNPWAAIGVVGLVGVVAGFLLFRRTSSTERGRDVI